MVVKPGKSTGEPSLWAYVSASPETPLTIAQLRHHLGGTLPEHMVPAFFVRVDKMPLTHAGKIDRKALARSSREPMEMDSEYTAPVTATEKTLQEIFQELLGRTTIGIDDNFFAMGGHSMVAVSLIDKAHTLLNRKIPLEAIYHTPTIRELAKLIDSEKEEKYQRIEPASPMPHYPLSSPQERLFVLDRMGSLDTAYNITKIVLLEGKLDKSALEKAFNSLWEKHEILRTSFQLSDEKPVQVIHPPDTFKDVLKVRYERVAQPVSAVPSSQVETYIKRFIQPFVLSSPPLLRVGVLEIAEERFYLIIDMHHIIADGLSMGIFVQELLTRYSGGQLVPLRIQYKDFAMWQRKRFQEGEIQKQEAYWLAQFDGEIPTLNLPYDFTPPALRDYLGQTVSFSITESQTRKLRHLAFQSESGLFIVLLALFQAFLSRLTGQEDIVVGAPAAGRRDPDLQPLIGMFVNTMALRHFPVGDKSFIRFFQEVKTNTLQALENQEYPFEELVNKVAAHRDIGRNPLFDIMFTLQDKTLAVNPLDETSISIQSPNGEPLTITPYIHKTPTAKFHITLEVFEVRQHLIFRFEYATALFKEETVKRYAQYFNSFIAALVEDPLQEIGRVQYLSDAEKELLLYSFNHTATHYPAHRTIGSLFQEQVRRFPHRVALVGPSASPSHPDPHTLTYRQLDRGAQAVAHYLTSQSASTAPDTIIALLMDRSIQMIISIIGVLKAGFAYLPIETQYPDDRIAFMLADSRAALLLTHRDVSKERPLEVKTLYYEDFEQTYKTDFFQKASSEGESLLAKDLPGRRSQQSSDLAYIIYTSGSTGKPKGVLTTHANVTRVVLETNYIHFTAEDRLLQLSNYAFDGSIIDIYGSLLNGGALVLMPGGKTAVDQIEEVIKRENITVFFATTALFNLLVDEKPQVFPRIRKALFGGERASFDHSRRALQFAGKNKIINGYGPTETTVFATYFPIDDVGEKATSIPIGKPLANTVVYLLDKYLQPAPIGVVGELYIGGAGTARGYLNRQELTAQTFLPNPFVEGDIMYKSGDLGVRLPNGDILFTDRIDHQVKIRGFRIELGEIENFVTAHPKVKEAVVTVYKTSGQTTDSTSTMDARLCAYIVPAPGLTALDLPSAEEFKQHLAVTLPDYMIPSFFVPLEALPLTSNGKVALKLLPPPFFPMMMEDSYTAPTDTIQSRLTSMWVDLLGVPAESVGIDTNFFKLGGHSLIATLLASRIQREWQVKISLADIFKAPTVRAIADIIRQAETAVAEELQKAETREHYPLSFNQHRIFILQRLDPSSPAYNIPARVELNRAVSEGAVEKALNVLMERHQSLRTYFKTVRHEPVQFVAQDVSLPYRFHDFFPMVEAQEGEHIPQRVQALYKDLAGAPFDLEAAPLFRAALVKLGPQKYQFMFNIHHIIGDGWSMEILKDEFFRLYEAFSQEPPAPIHLVELPYTYIDFALWHNDRLQLPEGQNPAADTWKKKLSGGITPFRLSGDFSEGIDSPAGAAYRSVLGEELKDVLIRLAEDYQTSLFTVMYALYMLMLSRVSRQEEIPCSVIIAGRELDSLQGIVGMFVNSLVMKTPVDWNEPFDTFLKRLIDDVLESFQYQSYPAEKIFEAMGERFPQIHVSFNMLNIIDSSGVLKADQFQSSHIPSAQDIKFDLEPYITQYKNGIEILWTYRKNMFETTTIEFMVSLYTKLIQFFATDTSRSLQDHIQAAKQAKGRRFKKKR